MSYFRSLILSLFLLYYNLTHILVCQCRQFRINNTIRISDLNIKHKTFQDEGIREVESYNTKTKVRNVTIQLHTTRIQLAIWRDLVENELIQVGKEVRLTNLTCFMKEGTKRLSTTKDTQIEVTTNKFITIILRYKLQSILTTIQV